MVVAFLFSLIFARKRAQRYGFTPDQVSDIAFYAIFAGIIGARIFFIVQELPHYLSNPKELLTLQFQGLTSFGGFIFGGIAAWWVCKRKELNPVSFLDLAAPAFLLGHIIGRFACLLNGCCHGRPATSAFPFLAYSPENHQYNVPAQLYDSAFNVVALLVVLRLSNSQFAHKPGFLVGIALALHGLARFIYEFFRAGTSSTTIWGTSFLTEAHIVAAVIALLGLGIAFRPTQSEELEPVVETITKTL